MLKKKWLVTIVCVLMIFAFVPLTSFALDSDEGETNAEATVQVKTEQKAEVTAESEEPVAEADEDAVSEEAADSKEAKAAPAASLNAESESVSVSVLSKTYTYDGTVHYGEITSDIIDGATYYYREGKEGEWIKFTPSDSNKKLPIGVKNYNQNKSWFKYQVKVEKNGKSATADGQIIIKYVELAVQPPAYGYPKDVTINGHNVNIWFQGENEPNWKDYTVIVGSDEALAVYEKEGLGIEFTLTKNYNSNGFTLISAGDAVQGNGNYHVFYRGGDIRTATTGGTTFDISTEDITKMYDGKAAEIKVSTEAAGTTTYYYSTDKENWSTEAPVLKNVSDSKTVYIKAKNKNFKEESKIAECKVSISKRQIEVTSGTPDPKVFDGTPLTDGTLSIKGDGFADGEGAEIKAAGSQTEAGTSANKIVVTFNNNTDAGNYDIVINEGKLTVTEANAAVVPGDGGNGVAAVAAAGVAAQPGYELTVVGEDQVPLAGNLLDGHCCVLHLFLIILAGLVLLYYARDMKKRQARIFELEEELNGYFDE
ncbi:MAG: hypothetical protein Q4D99_05175 [Bacillota bacterium]|nr:hypothetical protein [Bacillota bacterium]